MQKAGFYILFFILLAFSPLNPNRAEADTSMQVERIEKSHRKSSEGVRGIAKRQGGSLKCASTRSGNLIKERLLKPIRGYLYLFLILSIFAYVCFILWRAFFKAPADSPDSEACVPETRPIDIPNTPVRVRSYSSERNERIANGYPAVPITSGTLRNNQRRQRSNGRYTNVYSPSSSLVNYINHDGRIPDEFT
ncbi:MAG: hypothetical protein ACD_3C00057G0002 [uncultured bacterium (gcode 4)]|uniref:Integron gene cassette protein n=1 Tax=uncultured bacterium (gcode 4) TaxID=1234023 RepID=K2G2G9_9BACT|nr:MAG: hypothetical protein ACD_3C00057G0002 [uncultured bacterium (gcode 4)]